MVFPLFVSVIGKKVEEVVIDPNSAGQVVTLRKRRLCGLCDTRI